MRQCIQEGIEQSKLLCGISKIKRLEKKKTIQVLEVIYFCQRN